MIEALINELSQIIIALILTGMFISYMLKSEKLEREAIEKGFAEYDPKTKQFTWKDTQ